MATLHAIDNVDLPAPDEARIGPAGLPAVTERPSLSGVAPEQPGVALQSIADTVLGYWRGATASLGRLVRIAVVAASMGAVAVVAYQAGERLAGLAGGMTSVAAPVPPPTSATPDQPKLTMTSLSPAAPSVAPSAPAPPEPSGALGDGALDYVSRAKTGDPTAQYNIAVLYTRSGTAPDLVNAARWFREAAAGHPAAQFNLAVMYERGLGIEQRALPA